MKESSAIYRVLFVNQDELFEVYARQVYQAEMYGFIEIEEFVFDSRSQMLVDPGEERLKNLFGDVRRSFIPMHAIVRIDEVEKEGVCKVSEAKGQVTPFPLAPGPRND